MITILKLRHIRSIRGLSQLYNLNFFLWCLETQFENRRWNCSESFGA
jgi:hypothetical protein